MKNRIMHKDFAKAFRLILVIFIVLAVFTAVAIPLSLSQQISDLSSLRQTSQEQTAQQDGEHSEHHADREELWKIRYLGCIKRRWIRNQRRIY